MELLRYFTNGGEMDYRTWYEALEKPFFSPPSWAFGVAWSVIYPMIALAFILALVLYFKKKLNGATIIVFCVNLAANLLFAPIQMGLKNNLLASGDVVIILGTLVYIESVFWRRSKSIFWLLLPYLLWVSFATILQFSITVLNQ